ncbi:MAG: hypothetical protein ACI9W4_000930 [Rhodothermales bacterium]|jgi:hypothetical protein
MSMSALCLIATCLLLAGCSLDPIDQGTILVTVSASDAIVSPQMSAPARRILLSKD